MGSDPLRLTRPVNGFNLPNARGRSLGLSPLSFLASRSPLHSPGRPPPPEAIPASRAERNFDRDLPDPGATSPGGLAPTFPAVFV